MKADGEREPTVEEQLAKFFSDFHEILGHIRFQIGRLRNRAFILANVLAPKKREDDSGNVSFQIRWPDIEPSSAEDSWGDNGGPLDTEVPPGDTIE